MHLVDPRAGRFERGVVVVVLLAGFVFRQPWSIPIATLIAVAGAVMNERSPMARAWSALGSRRRRQVSLVPAHTNQVECGLVAAFLLLACLLLLAGSVALAAIPATVAAILAALGATGVMSPVAELRRRRDR
jgi:Domain of unknown function (DUF4395)